MNIDQTSDPNELRERCFAYLTGEMTDRDVEQFESELSDPRVADALSRESELILAVSHSQPLNQLVRASSTNRSLGNILAIGLSALAASLLLAIPLLFPPETLSSLSQGVSTADALPGESYDLAVAIKWAKPAVHWDQPHLWSDAEQQLLDDSLDARSMDDASEESLDWMVAAVQATLPASEEKNDG